MVIVGLSCLVMTYREFVRYAFSMSISALRWVLWLRSGLLWFPSLYTKYVMSSSLYLFLLVSWEALSGRVKEVIRLSRANTLTESVKISYDAS